MIYIFAGYPKNDLHAGGLQYCVEDIECLAILKHDPVVQYRKLGVFAAGTEEMLYPIEAVLSPTLERDGITWDWFPEHFTFGNGVTVHKTIANRKNRTVQHGPELYERWDMYESRWLPGTCPQNNHIVHLTWLVTAHDLPDFAYQRIRSLIENGSTPERAELYERPDEPGKYLSASRIFTG